MNSNKPVLIWLITLLFGVAPAIAIPELATGMELSGRWASFVGVLAAAQPDILWFAGLGTFCCLAYGFTVLCVRMQVEKIDGGEAPKY
jgi:hypothetical protein